MGKIFESTAKEVTIAGDDNQNHTVSTSQIRSLEYDDSNVPPLPALAQTPPPVETAPPAQATPPSSPAPQPERRFGADDHENHYHPPESSIHTRTFVVPSGTAVPVRVEETIDSARAVDGQTFAAEITRDVMDREGAVVIPHGSNAQIVIRSATKGGRVQGQSDLVLDLASISVEGRRYKVSTADIAEKGREGIGTNKRTGVFAGGGSAFGAIIGAIAGGGKGAAIGAVSGAAAGAGSQVLTRGKSVRVPVESILTFRLDRPLRIETSR